MRLRTFHAATMKQAMEQIREEIGEEAVIVNTSKATNNQGVTVTVAQQDADEQTLGLHEQIVNENNHAARFASMPDFVIKELETILYAQGAEEVLINAVLTEARQLDFPADDITDGVQHILTETLRRLCEFEPINFNQEGLRLILIGAPGVGKTLTVAKITSRIVKSGHKPVVITTDFKRAGGVEQLSALTDVMGIQLHVACNRTELKSILSQCTPEDRVIIDSPGANPYEFQELKELGEFAGLMELTPALVFSAGDDPEDAAELARAFAFLGIKHMIITRTDLTRRFASALTAAHAAGLCFSHITGTEKILGHFEAITPQHLGELLMRHNPT